ncbi:MAG TPA: hypothetical protein VIJ27_00820 [Mucilaginibacter sp.]
MLYPNIGIIFHLIKYKKRELKSIKIRLAGSGEKEPHRPACLAKPLATDASRTEQTTALLPCKQPHPLAGKCVKGAGIPIKNKYNRPHLYTLDAFARVGIFATVVIVQPYG